MIGNKIADNSKVWRTSPQKTSDTVTCETKIKGFDIKIPNERYKPPEKR